MTLAAIVAMARNRVIGRANALPWYLSADLKRFKRLTLGHCMLMGRRTWESIGRALPGRTSIVVTRQLHYRVPPGVKVVASLEEGLEAARHDSEAFVIGGAHLFAEALPRLERLYLTLIEADIEGDTRLPEVDLSTWHLREQEAHPPGPDFPHPYRFLTYERPR